MLEVLKKYFDVKEVDLLPVRFCNKYETKENYHMMLFIFTFILFLLSFH